MMGTQPNTRQPALFSYRVDLEPRLGPDHLLRRVSAHLDLSFVLPAVQHCYGRCGNVSVDPRVIVKLMRLLFLYNIPSERELMEQLAVRLDFLWFLGLDLDSPVPDHSVLSKARKRWGEKVFEQLFMRTVAQCVAVGLVEGRLLHADSTMVKAQAHKDSVVPSGAELVNALRQAYQQQEAKLEVLPALGTAREVGVREAPVTSAAGSAPASTAVEICSSPRSVAPLAEIAPAPVAAATAAPESTPSAPEAPVQSAPATKLPKLEVVQATTVSPVAEAKPAAGRKLPVNQTHISTTDPLAELARSKNGLTELNYKEHRLVDDAHGVITAVLTTTANVADGTQLPALYEQHLATSGIKAAETTVAGDHHYGTADNYLYCAQEGIRAHLGQVSANLKERGKLGLDRFTYLPAVDRLRCPQGHELVCHQHRVKEQLKVYWMEDPTVCGQCPLRAQCTESKGGRTIQRHVQADLIEAARQKANSPAGRYSRRRRQHVMEGSFADAANNHGAKKARWRGLGRQRIQSWLIAAVQNLRILLRHPAGKPAKAAVMALVTVAAQAAAQADGRRLGSRLAGLNAFRKRMGCFWPFGIYRNFALGNTHYDCY